MTIRGILFDKDGTLIDVNDTWVPLYRQILMEMMGASPDEAEAMMEKAGLDRASGRFLPGSILAGGTTRQLVEIWWPGIGEAEAAAKARVFDHDYAEQAKHALKPLMPVSAFGLCCM